MKAPTNHPQRTNAKPPNNKALLSRPIKAVAISALLAGLALVTACDKKVRLDLDLIEPVDQTNQALNGVQTIRIEYRPLDEDTGLPSTDNDLMDSNTLGLDETNASSGVTFALEEQVFITIKAFAADASEDPGIVNGAPDSIGRTVPVRPSNGDVNALQVTLPVGVLDSFGVTTTRDPESGDTSQTRMDSGVAIVGRHGHSATYLPALGKVLIVGGAVWTDANGASPDLPQCRDFSGTVKCFTILQSAELFDPATGLFETIAELPNARAYHTATLLGDGTVLIAGGFSFFSENATVSLQTLVNGFIFQPAEIEGDPISAPIVFTARRAMHTATLIDDQGGAGQVAFIGGCHGTGCTPFGAVNLGNAPEDDPVNRVVNTVEIYDVEAGSSTAVALSEDFKLALARMRHQTTRMGDFLVVSGGLNSTDTRCNIEILGISGGTLIQPEPYPQDAVRTLIDCPVGHTQVTIARDTVAIIGGILEAPGGLPSDASAPSSRVQFWTTTGPSAMTLDLLSGRAFHQSVLLQNGSILNIGGRIPAGGATAERLDASVGGGFTPSAVALPLPDARSDLSAAIMPNNQVLVTGGYDDTGTSTDEAMLYFGD